MENIGVVAFLVFHTWIWVAVIRMMFWIKEKEDAYRQDMTDFILWKARNDQKWIAKKKEKYGNWPAVVHSYFYSGIAASPWNLFFAGLFVFEWNVRNLIKNPEIYDEVVAWKKEIGVD